MEVVARILKSTVAGVALGAVLTTIVFAASVLVDGGRVGEAFGFGLAIGVVTPYGEKGCAAKSSVMCNAECARPYSKQLPV